MDHLACELNYANFMRQLTGIYFLAHVVGWWAKMVIFRDFTVCLIYSVTFELFELTLQFLIPEFQECWWDSLLMDVSFANMLGMQLGLLTLKWLKLLPYAHDNHPPRVGHAPRSWWPEM